MQFFRHLFTPHHRNNYRAKVLHNSSLLILVLLFFVLSGATYFIKSAHPAVLGISYSITEGDLLQNTNQARLTNSLPVLSLNPQLSDAARRKAAYMLEKNFWAHFGPDGTTPWSFIKAAGYDYQYAGENMAKGFTNSSDIVNTWMNSPSHKENLLSTKYIDVGFAVVEGKLLGEDTVLVVQMFGAQSQNVAAQATVSPVVAKVAEVEAKAVVPQPSVVTQIPVPTVQAVAQQASRPIVNASSVTKVTSASFLIFLIAILILDLVIVEKRKIPRIVGHNLDHIILLILFLLFIILQKTGGIL